MIVYEFWLKEQLRNQTFDALCEGFYKIGGKIIRKVDNGAVELDTFWDWDIEEFVPNPKAGELIRDSAVYSTSRNPDTRWVQLLVDDNATQPIITAIEARIDGLKDDEPFRKYVDDMDNNSPIETPKHFSLDRVLRVRQKQKDRTLGPIEDVE